MKEFHMSTATMEMPVVAPTKSNKKSAVKAEVKPTETSVPVIKQTPVEERKYQLTAIGQEHSEKFRGKQRQIVFDVLKAATKPMTYTEVAREAEKLELKAVGGIDLSCRYHLHHLALENLAEVTNLAINVAEDPTLTEK
jgi:hypothetical protein